MWSWTQDLDTPGHSIASPRIAGELKSRGEERFSHQVRPKMPFWVKLPILDGFFVSHLGQKRWVSTKWVDWNSSTSQKTWPIPGAGTRGPRCLRDPGRTRSCIQWRQSWTQEMPCGGNETHQQKRSLTNHMLIYWCCQIHLISFECRGGEGEANPSNFIHIEYKFVKVEHFEAGSFDENNLQYRPGNQHSTYPDPDFVKNHPLKKVRFFFWMGGYVFVPSEGKQQCLVHLPWTLPGSPANEGLWTFDSMGGAGRGLSCWRGIPQSLDVEGNMYETFGSSEASPQLVKAQIWMDGTRVAWMCFWMILDF